MYMYMYMYENINCPIAAEESFIIQTEYELPLGLLLSFFLHPYAATFLMKSETGVQWELRAAYSIEAELIGAETTCVC